MVVKFSATKLLQVLCNEVNASAKVSLALIDCTLIYSLAGSPGATCYETSIKNIPTHYVLPCQRRYESHDKTNILFLLGYTGPNATLWFLSR